ncbi:MAG: DUF2490 domain-containing protein [Flavihumibacter sp.]|nr:DUF2490 domain-containing protein [Flavihumibacter sp.]
MKPVKIILIAIVAMAGSHAFAQEQYVGWLASFNTVKLNKKFSLHTDVQWRSTHQWQHTQTFFVRPGINYHLKKNMTLTAGVGLFHNRRVLQNVSGYVNEKRIWQQYLITHPAGSAVVAHRFRLEQRFIPKSTVQNNQLYNNGNLFAQRFRYFIRAIQPLQQQKKFTKGWFAAVQNEVFLNMGDNNALNNKVFDQNRLYFAMGYRLAAKADLEMGYLNQYVVGSKKSFSNIHAFQTAVYLRL